MTPTERLQRAEALVERAQRLIEEHGTLIEATAVAVPAADTREAELKASIARAEAKRETIPQRHSAS